MVKAALPTKLDTRETDTAEIVDWNPLTPFESNDKMFEIKFTRNVIRPERVPPIPSVRVATMVLLRSSIACVTISRMSVVPASTILTNPAARSPIAPRKESL